MHISFFNYIKWGFESRLKQDDVIRKVEAYYIKWGFESRLKRNTGTDAVIGIISNGDLRVD